MDDTNDFRPGIKSAENRGIRSPLIEAELSKEEIRKISKEIHLPNWNKPAQACLSSRIPYGEKISTQQLEKIESAEKFLKTLGLGTLRIRSHGNLARIEVSENQINQIIQKNTRSESDSSRLNIISKEREANAKIVSRLLEKIESNQ